MNGNDRLGKVVDGTGRINTYNPTKTLSHTQTLPLPIPCREESTLAESEQERGPLRQEPPEGYQEKPVLSIVILYPYSLNSMIRGESNEKKKLKKIEKKEEKKKKEKRKKKERQKTREKGKKLTGMHLKKIR